MLKVECLIVVKNIFIVARLFRVAQVIFFNAVSISECTNFLNSSLIPCSSVSLTFEVLRVVDCVSESA